MSALAAAYLLIATLALLIVMLAVLVALRMRQKHELALIAARPPQNAGNPDLAKLEERIVTLERNAAMAATKKRRA